jgi:CheY-like chemotaxis protein
VVPATDVYSFGCVLYEMLTGTVPFEGKNLITTAQKHLMERPRPLRTLNSGVSSYVEGIVLKCLAKTPAERYRDSAALLEDLERARERFHHKEPTEVSRRRAILGEPDAEEARMLTEVLDRFGLDVVRVTDGYGLVEAALGRGTDVVFVNVYMPKISGLEASQILRSFPRTAITPIVLLSDRSADRDLAKLIPRGGEFLKKPIEDDDFTSLFKRIGLPLTPAS